MPWRDDTPRILTKDVSTHFNRDSDMVLWSNIDPGNSDVQFCSKTMAYGGHNCFWASC